MAKRDAERVVVVQQGGQAIPALANVFLPGLGHLIQGRFFAAIIWLIVNVLAAASMLILVGFALFPLVWIWCILDAARYSPRVRY